MVILHNGENCLASTTYKSKQKQRFAAGTHDFSVRIGDRY